MLFFQLVPALIICVNSVKFRKCTQLKILRIDKLAKAIEIKVTCDFWFEIKSKPIVDSNTVFNVNGIYITQYACRKYYNPNNIKYLQTIYDQQNKRLKLKNYAIYLYFQIWSGNLNARLQPEDVYDLLNKIYLAAALTIC